MRVVPLPAQIGQEGGARAIGRVGHRGVPDSSRRGARRAWIRSPH